MEKAPRLAALDHLVLTVADIAAACAFYADLGMTPEQFEVADGTARWALRFGSQKINLHQQGSEFTPNAAHATVGSGDLCFLSEAPLADWVAHLATKGHMIEQGPVARSGASGPIMSIYLRDPDGNLIEISNRA